MEVYADDAERVLALGDEYVAQAPGSTADDRRPRVYVKALALVARPRLLRDSPLVVPSARYHRLCMKGAEEVGLAPEYRAWLAAHPVWQPTRLATVVGILLLLPVLLLFVTNHVVRRCRGTSLRVLHLLIEKYCAAVLAVVSLFPEWLWSKTPNQPPPSTSLTADGQCFYNAADDNDTTG